jgi:hypothetical protein
MSWYKQSMPTVADLMPVIDGLCKEIKAIAGVTDVYLWGSYMEHLDKPTYAVKDVDIIAATNFDSGDLLAIDNSKYSALRLHPNDLEDEGFNPQAVAFTKRFLSYSKYNVDHWAVSRNGKLLHWGAMPDNQDDWAELHAEAEARARETCGVKRAELHRATPEKRSEWKGVYDSYIASFLSKKATGWCQSQHKFAEIAEKAKKV